MAPRPKWHHTMQEARRQACLAIDFYNRPGDRDVGTFVRLYDFMSQIIDYGDPDPEKKQIYLRLLERLIQPNNYTATTEGLLPRGTASHAARRRRARPAGKGQHREAVRREP